MATIDKKKFYELESGDQIALENGLRADIMGESEDGQWVGIRYTADAGELAHSGDLLHVDEYDPDLAFCQCRKQRFQSADQTFRCPWCLLDAGSCLCEPGKVEGGC